MTLSECTLSSNTAERGGGAVAVEAGAEMRLERCTLTDNSCGTFGGAVYGGFLPSASVVVAAATSIQQCTFERNVGRGTGPVRAPWLNPPLPIIPILFGCIARCIARVCQADGAVCSDGVEDQGVSKKRCKAKRESLRQFWKPMRVAFISSRSVS